MGKLKIHRRAHPRRSFRKRNGTYIQRTHVRAATFDIEDRGAPGRGSKVIKITKPGALKELGYSAFASAEQRRKALEKAVAKYGERSVIGMLQAQAVFRKRTDGLAKVFASDRTWVAKSYGTYRGKNPTFQPFMQLPEVGTLAYKRLVAARGPKPRRAYQLSGETIEDPEHTYGYATSEREFIRGLPKMTKLLIRKKLVKVKPLGKVKEFER